MNRLKFFVIFFTIFFISLALRVHPSYAQQIAGFNSDCLEATITGNFHSADLSVPTAEKRAQKGYKLPKGDGRKTWIFVCVATTHGNKCTTGNPTVDFEVFQKTADYDDILKNPNYSLKDIGGVVRGTNPIAMVGEGDPQFAQPVTWTDEYIPPTAHTWMWVQAADPVLDVSEAGAKGAQQQATFDFLHTQADSSKCTQLGWDPKGYVFDAKTLYPVKGVAITIAQKGASGLYSDMESRIGLTNPDISLDRNGQYSFFTPPGTYKLRITSSNATLAETVSINPAYKKAFTLTDPISTLYNEGQEIVEREGDVAVSHMPVIIANDDLLIKDLAVIWRKEEKSASDEIYFSGALSHPKSLIKITATYIDEDGKLFQDVSTKMTNEIGEYKFSLPQTKTIAQIKPTDEKIIFLTKYDVTFSLNPEIYSNPGIQSPTNSFSGEVIPAYIDGIAYDVDGKPIIEAVVGLYPSYSENAMFYTTTDQNGKYMIGSQHIPESQYSLRYKKNTGEVVQVDTSTFIKQNVGYFVTNEIKPFNQRKATLIEEKNSQELFTKIVGNKTPDMTSVAKGSKNNSGLKNELRNSTQQSSSTLLDSAQRAVGAQGIIIGLVILILVIISGGVFVILKSKKAPMQ